MGKLNFLTVLPVNVCRLAEQLVEKNLATKGSVGIPYTAARDTQVERKGAGN